MYACGRHWRWYMWGPWICKYKHTKFKQVHIYIYIYIYYVYIYIYVYIVHIQIYLHIYTCIHTHMHIYICIYIYMRMHTYIYKYIHTYTYACIHTYIVAYTHIHTYICIYKQTHKNPKTHLTHTFMVRYSNLPIFKKGNKRSYRKVIRLIDAIIKIPTIIGVSMAVVFIIRKVATCPEPWP